MLKTFSIAFIHKEIMLKKDNLLRRNLYSEDKCGIIYRDILKVSNFQFWFYKSQDFLIVLCPRKLYSHIFGLRNDSDSVL